MIRPLLLCGAFGLCGALFGCGARPAAPAPPAPEGLLFNLQVGDLGGSLARVSQLAARLGARIDVRAPLQAHLAQLSGSARLDGPWWLLGFEEAGEPGLALVMFGAPGSDEPAWRAHPLGRWETAIRRFGADRLVATDRPGWIDAHAGWIDGLRPRPGADLQLELPLAQSVGPAPPEALGEADLKPSQRALLDDTWALVRQTERLGLAIDLTADRVIVTLRVEPKAESDLARAVAQLEPLPPAAWDRVPEDRLAALGCRLPVGAWTGFDRALRAAGGELLGAPPADLRATAFEALGGDLVLSLGGAAPGVIAHLKPRSGAALDRLFAAAEAEPDGVAHGIAISRVPHPDGEPIRLARLEGGLLATAGAGNRAVMEALLAADRPAGPRADADLADALERTAGASCVALVDGDATAAALGERPSGAPPLHAAIAARGGALELRVDLPLIQLRQLIQLWLQQGIEVPRVEPRAI